MRLTIPNMITIMRFVLVPAVVLAMLQARWDWAFAGFLIAGLPWPALARSAPRGAGVRSDRHGGNRVVPSAPTEKRAGPAGPLFVSGGPAMLAPQ